MCRVISFVSAKGGVGKTTLIYNVSKLVSNKYKVCVFDAYFGMNEVSLLYQAHEVQDLKEYLIGRIGTFNVLNRVKDNLYFVRTNNSSFDYMKHRELIKFFISEVMGYFDYIFIDVNSLDKKNLELMLECSSESIVICTDEEIDIRNTSKMIYYIKTFKNVCAVNLILNKVRVIKSIKKRCLDEKDIFELLKVPILFTIPKLYKNNFFNNRNLNFKRYSLLNKLSYSIITNKRVYFDVCEEYCGIVGFFKRIRYAKYE